MEIVPAGRRLHAPEFRMVSRRHCVVEVDATSARVRDCGSRNGTYLNGMQIGRPASWLLPPQVAAAPIADYDLHDRDTLRIGEAVFQVRVAKTPAEVPDAPKTIPGGKSLCA